MDEFCLKEGKRCIMWDDEGSGFFLVHFSLISHHQCKQFLHACLQMLLTSSYAADWHLALEADVCCKALSTGAYANSTLTWAVSSCTLCCFADDEVGLEQELSSRNAQHP